MPMSSNLKFGAKMAFGAALFEAQFHRSDESLKPDVLFGTGLDFDGTITSFHEYNICLIH